MALHLDVAEKPVGAVRPIELGITGIRGRHSSRRSGRRIPVRDALFRPAARHRTTFIPLDTYSLHAD